MENRETTKIIEIQGRKFLIKKVDPFTGSYIVTTMAAKVLPASLSAFMGVVTESKEKMTKEEFVDFQKDIISCVYEILDAGEVNLLDRNGNPQVIDLTPQLLIRLTGEALKFNFEDFFDASLWKGLLPEALVSMFTKHLTSMNFFSLLFQKDTGDNANSGTEHTTSQI